MCCIHRLQLCRIRRGTVDLRWLKSCVKYFGNFALIFVKSEQDLIYLPLVEQNGYFIERIWANCDPIIERIPNFHGIVTTILFDFLIAAVNVVEAHAQDEGFEAV